MDKFRKLWEPVDRVVFGTVRHLCELMLAALVAVVFYIFVGRYFLHQSPMWGEPMSLFLLTWMSIMGSSLVLRTDEHLKVTMFDEKTDLCNGRTCNSVYHYFCSIYGNLRRTAYETVQKQYDGGT